MFSRANNGRTGQAVAGPLSVSQNNVAAGSNRPRPDKFKPQGPPTRPSDAVPAKQTVGFNVTPSQNERLLYALLLLVGRKIEVQVKSGAVYEGVLYTANFEPKDMHIVLRLPKVVKEATGKGADRHKLAEKPPAKLVIYSNDLVGFLAQDVEERWRGEDALETDGDISRGKAGIVGRELQPWIPDNEDGFDMGLESSADYAPGWDQFAVNQQMFGVQSTWDEAIYTTVLDKNKSKISETVAEQIAREIERGNVHSTNLHVLEERGLEIDDSGIDEEDKYSSVLRDSYSNAPMPSHADRRGGPSSRHSENGNSKLPAWSSHGAGVAAVAGRNLESGLHPQQLPPTPQLQPIQPQPPAPAVPVLPQPVMSSISAPIDIDIRKETNRIRSQLAGPKKAGSSPAHGTPKGMKSPLISPLISNPEMLEALNLDPGQTKLEPEVYNAFMEFKAKARQDKAEQTKKEMQELKASAERIRLSKAEDRVGSAPLASQELATPPSTPNLAGSTAAAVTPDSKPAPSTPVRDTKPLDSSDTPALQVCTADMSASPSDRKLESASVSKLRASAPSFKFNINAKEFVPGSSGTTPPSATKMIPPPAVTPTSNSNSNSKPITPPTPTSTPTLSTSTPAAAAPTPTPPPREREREREAPTPSTSSAPIANSTPPSHTPTPPPSSTPHHPSSNPPSHRSESSHHPPSFSNPNSSSKHDNRPDHSYGTPSSMSTPNSQPRDGPSYHPSIALSTGAMHHPQMAPMPGQFPTSYMAPHGYTMPGSMLSHGMMGAMVSGPMFSPMARMAGPHGHAPYGYAASPFGVPAAYHQFMGPSPAASRMYGGPAGMPHFAMSPAMAPMAAASPMAPHDRPHGGRGRPHRHSSHMSSGSSGGAGERSSGHMRNEVSGDMGSSKEHYSKQQQRGGGGGGSDD